MQIKLTLNQKGLTFLIKIQKTGRDFQKNIPKSIKGVQRQMWRTDIQESKELAEKKYLKVSKLF